MTIQTRPVQAQPNIRPDVIPAPPVRVAAHEEELQVVHLTVKEIVMIGQKHFTKTIRAKEDRARFQFDDVAARVWVYLEIKPGEELVGWIPYSNVANVYFGVRSTVQVTKGAA